MVYELRNAVMRDFRWPGVHGKPRGFHQVHDRHSFLIIVLRYFKPSSYEVNLVTDFSIKGSFPF